MIYTLAWTGLRLSEACALQWADLDFMGHFLTVNRTATCRDHRVILGAPKSGKARRVDLPSALVRPAADPAQHPRGRGSRRGA